MDVEDSVRNAMQGDNQVTNSPTALRVLKQINIYELIIQNAIRHM